MEPGRQLAHYRIVAKIGEGGMGVVWRATDTRLGREVAIKVLPREVAADPHRLARFEREARTLAALHHSYIASIFGLHEADGIRFLAMELVRGEDLARRIARGPLPLDEALELTRQIAEALESAHAEGIVHRDLKPANVMVTPEGEVRVLDFGLAKAMDPEGDRDPADSPTMTSTGTLAGAIIGTACYMSPEQAKGKPVDRRADVWALGALLFEMLSGERAFKGESVPEMLASVLRSEPDWQALPDETPPGVRRLLRRALNKDPRMRLHDVADARIVLTEALSGAHPEPTDRHTSELSVKPPPLPPPRSPSWMASAALIVSGVVVGLALGWMLFVGARTPVEPAPAVHLQIDASMLDFSTGTLPFAFSPDGRMLVYADYAGATTQLFLRHVDRFEPVPLAGTEGAGAPFFAPDGDWIGFYAGNRLKRVAVAGGAPVTICEVPHAPGGATWLDSGDIVWSMAFTPTSLYLVSPDGGPVTALTTVDGAGGESNHSEPFALPGGEALLFTIHHSEGKQVAVLRLADGRVEPLSGVQGRARFVPDAGDATVGQLLYGTEGSLLAAPFDLGRLEHGAAEAILEDVRGFQGGAAFAVSASGALAFLPAAQGGFDHVWVDRAGVVTPMGLEERSGGRPILSRDGTRLAVTGGTRARSDRFFVHDLERGGRVRATGNSHALWLPGDSEFVTTLKPEGTGRLYRLRVDGTGEPVALRDEGHPAFATGLSRDGAWLLFYEQHPETSRDIWALPLDRPSAALPLVVTPGSDRAAVFSPDGRWFAYTSNVSGRDEVYVRRFDPSGAARAGGEQLVSTEGGREPQWSHDGTELFYRAGRAMMVVEVDVGEAFEAGEPRLLFEGSWGVESGGMNQMYDVSADGRRLVMVRADESANRIHLVLGG